MKDLLVSIARVKGPRGLKGQIWLRPYGDSFEQFKHYKYIMVGKDHRPLEVVHCQQKGNMYIVELKGLNTREQVDSIKGEEVFIKKEWLPPLEKDEYYWCDLIGMQVFDLEGTYLGDLLNIFRTGSNDVYVVNKEKEYLIPATVDVVKEVSIKESRMIIDTAPLEGLME